MKKKTVLFVSLFCWMGSSVFAQEIKDLAIKSYEKSTKADTSVKEHYWTLGGLTLLTFSQDYTLNWAAGGDPALSVKGTGNYFLRYNKNRLSWDNTLNFDYGMQRNLETKVNTKTSPIKSEIFARLNEKFGNFAVSEKELTPYNYL